MKLPLSPTRPLNACQGFSLIELLSVIAVIGLLAAIIVPAVNRVRERAAMAHSAGNLRQLGTAALLYASDHQGDYPQGGWPAKWHDQVYAYVDDKTDVFTDAANQHEYNSWVNFSDGETLPFDYGYNSHVNTLPECQLATWPYLTGPANVYADVDKESLPLIYTIARQNNFVYWCFDLEPASGNDQAYDPRFGGQGHILWLDGHLTSPTYEELMASVAARGGSVNFVTGKRQ